MASGGRGGRGVIPVPLFGLASARTGVPIPMSYPVLVSTPVPPPMIFLDLFLSVCNLAIVNAADAGAALRLFRVCGCFASVDL